MSIVTALAEPPKADTGAPGPLRQPQARLTFIMATGDGMLDITPDLRLPLHELTFRASRAGGPGGQHVNRSATRIELWWSVRDSPSLDDRQRDTLLRRLEPRLDGQGRLRLVAGSRRSQTMNRQEATRRFIRLIGQALKVARPRRPTRPTAASLARRRRDKQHRARRKEARRERPEDEG